MSWYNPLSWWGSSGNTRHQGYQSEAPNGGASSSEVSGLASFDASMTVSAFWASVRLLSEVVASMPLKCYERMPDGSRKQVTNNQIWRVLNFKPNRYQSRVEYFETLMMNLVTDGNCYSRLMKTPRGVSSYLPLMSSQMQVKLMPDGDIQYEYTDFNSEKEIIPSDEIWHVKLIGNSIVGMSPLAYARKTLGIAIATENRVGKIAKNGGKVSGVLMVDQVLQPPQRDKLRDNMADIASGDTDTLKILEADMKWQQIGLSPQDLQMLESRRYNIEDIARFMGVPSVLINDTSGSTVWGSGIHQIMQGFYKVNLKPYLTRFESSIKLNLMPPEDWERYDIEFDFDSLLRADRATRLDTNSKAINSGQLTPNEARNDEGLEDKEGGDDIYLNGTLTPAGKDAEPMTDSQRIDQIETKQNEAN